MEQKIYQVSKNWLNASIYGVVIDDCPQLRHLCQNAKAWRSLENLDDRIAAAKAQVLEVFTKNAVALKNTAQTTEEQIFYHSFVNQPTEEQTNLSYALRKHMACCRYYHALLFILLKECGIIAKAYGKIIPDSVGYTWVLAMDNNAGPMIIDLFSESLTRANITELDYVDPTGKYQNPGFAWVFKD